MKLTESSLRNIIKKELKNVLNEMSYGHHFERQEMSDINKISQSVNNRPSWNYNNRMYAVFKPAEDSRPAQYWIRKPLPTDGEYNIESNLIDLLYNLKIIQSPSISKQELQKMKNENLPVRDQFGSIGSSSA